MSEAPSRAEATDLGRVCGALVPALRGKSASLEHRCGNGVLIRLKGGTPVHGDAQVDRGSLVLGALGGTGE